MKAKLFMVFITVLTLGTFGVAQGVASDVGKAAKDTVALPKKQRKKLLTAR